MFSRRTNWKLSPNRYTQAVEAARAAGEQLLDLTVSNPTQCGFQYDEAGILAAFQNPRALCYEPDAKGLLAARQEVARYYKEDHGTTVDTDALLLTTSTSEAYSDVFRLLCDPGDEVLVPKPSYPLFEFLADLQDVSLIPYPLEYAQGWFVDLRSLRAALTPTTRALLLVHPNNPTGSYIHAEEAAELKTLCRERNLPLVVDEVFLDYPLDRPPAETFAGSHHTLTFTLSGLSKIAALPQMKVAWVALSGPEVLRQEALARLEVIADTYLSVNAPTQWAFPALFEQRRRLQPQIVRRARQNWNQLKRIFSESDVAEVLDSEAGWYAVLRLHNRVPDEGLTIELLQRTGTLVHPGHFYDFPKEGYLVVSLLPPLETFREGISRLAQFLAASLKEG